jgi:hypothetical protein
MPEGTCRDCGQSGIRYDNGQGGYCVDCQTAYGYAPYDYDDYEEDDYETGENGIHDWNYRPELHFYGEGPYHLGFELEISASSYDVSPITRWCENNEVPGMLYVKEDGSVNGFEIVSHPMTPEFFDGLPWESFFEMLQRHYPHDGNEAEGHGLHVHVSRTAFPYKSTLARWSYLINRNVEHVQRVARRTNQRWCQFIEHPVSAVLPYESAQNDGEWFIDYANPLACQCCYPREWREYPNRRRLTYQCQSRVNPHERYRAVNLCNDATVEVRVFRSTRKPEEFVQSIHLVTATVDFARSMQRWHATRLATSWDAFTDYVRSHPVFNKDADVFAGTPAMPPPELDTSPHAIRMWAHVFGFDIGTRGRIPADIRQAYIQSNGAAPVHTLSN